MNHLRTPHDSANGFEIIELIFLSILAGIGPRLRIEDLKGGTEGPCRQMLALEKLDSEKEMRPGSNAGPRFSGGDQGCG